MGFWLFRLMRVVEFVGSFVCLFWELEVVVRFISLSCKVVDFMHRCLRPRYSRPLRNHGLTTISLLDGWMQGPKVAECGASIGGRDRSEWI